MTKQTLKNILSLGLLAVAVVTGCTTTQPPATETATRSVETPR